MGERVFVFAQLNAGLNSNRNRTNDGTTTNLGPRVINSMLSLSGGVALFPTEHIAIDLGYTLAGYQLNLAGGNVASNRIYAGVNTLAPTIGVRYFF